MQLWVEPAVLHGTEVLTVSILTGNPCGSALQTPQTLPVSRCCDVVTPVKAWFLPGQTLLPTSQPRWCHCCSLFLWQPTLSPQRCRRGDHTQLLPNQKLREMWSSDLWERGKSVQPALMWCHQMMWNITLGTWQAQRTFPECFWWASNITWLWGAAVLRWFTVFIKIWKITGDHTDDVISFCALREVYSQRDCLCSQSPPAGPCCHSSPAETEHWWQPE